MKPKIQNYYNHIISCERLVAAYVTEALSEKLNKASWNLARSCWQKVVNTFFTITKKFFTEEELTS